MIWPMADAKTFDPAAKNERRLGVLRAVPTACDLAESDVLSDAESLAVAMEFDLDAMNVVRTVEAAPRTTVSARATMLVLSAAAPEARTICCPRAAKNVDSDGAIEPRMTAALRAENSDAILADARPVAIAALFETAKTKEPKTILPEARATATLRAEIRLASAPRPEARDTVAVLADKKVFSDDDETARANASVRDATNVVRIFAPMARVTDSVLPAMSVVSADAAEARASASPRPTKNVLRAPVPRTADTAALLADADSAREAMPEARAIARLRDMAEKMSAPLVAPTALATALVADASHVVRITLAPTCGFVPLRAGGPMVTVVPVSAPL